MLDFVGFCWILLDFVVFGRKFYQNCPKGQKSDLKSGMSNLFWKMTVQNMAASYPKSRSYAPPHNPHWASLWTSMTREGEDNKWPMLILKRHIYRGNRRLKSRNTNNNHIMLTTLKLSSRFAVTPCVISTIAKLRYRFWKEPNRTTRRSTVAKWEIWFRENHGDFNGFFSTFRLACSNLRQENEN